MRLICATLILIKTHAVFESRKVTDLLHSSFILPYKEMQIHHFLVSNLWKRALQKGVPIKSDYEMFCMM